MSQKIRIKLGPYDHMLVDKSAEKIATAVQNTSALVSGPAPLLMHKRIFMVNCSTFTSKKSREQFKLNAHKRLIDVYSASAPTIDALMKLEMPSGTDIEIKYQPEQSTTEVPELLGRRIGVTLVFSVEGVNMPCIVIEASPYIVTQVKIADRDGYEAIQLGLQDAKDKHTTRLLQGHFKAAGMTNRCHLAEFIGFGSDYKLDDEITVKLLNGTHYADVHGMSKGRRFQGVVKHHGFGGVGQSTCGRDDRLRAPGAVGACSYPARVFKGARMAGQMDNKCVAVQGLEVIKVMPEHNILVPRGSVPGAKGSIIAVEE